MSARVVRAMKVKKNKRGFTMAETLIVVAIVAILGAVSFIGVLQYQRSLAQFERDGIAKEIFVAAQNHLTMAENQGYLGLGNTQFGTEEKDINNRGTGIYYLVVNQGVCYPAEGKRILDLMLPLAAVDETVRLGGSYIIRYQAEPAILLDVFYCSAAGTRFGYSLSQTHYATVLGLRDTNDADYKMKMQRRRFDGAVLGWYGGESARELTLGEKMEAPTVEIINAEKLYVTVSDPNYNNSEGYLTLIVTGNTSQKEKTFILRKGSETSLSLPSQVTYDGTTHVYTVILDDITTQGRHFKNLMDGFIPGEDITVQAVAFSNSVLTNIEYSAEKTANSLFASVEASTSGGVIDTAFISNIRHLENLGDNLSAVQYSDTNNKLAITNAKQTTDLNWADFLTSVKTGSESIKIYAVDSTALYNNDAANDTYWPVNPSYALNYDGQNHTISNIDAKSSGNAGLFGELKKVSSTESSVSNLMLVDFSIESTGENANAGALAGALTGAKVTNVVARNSNSLSTAAVTVSVGYGAAGGLVGSAASNSTILYSAASLSVSSESGSAGGLVGTMTDGKISACYAGGHTENGIYDSDNYNVITYNPLEGSYTGGLVGYAGAAQIENSYTTCSAKGATAGGLVGTANGTITNCYATGLVSGTTAAGAFAGTYTGSYIAGKYFEIINPDLPAIGGTVPDSGVDVTAFDENLSTYNEFIGEPSVWQSAGAYDTTLIMYFQGQYGLRTVKQLDNTVPDSCLVITHYGDWPAPELLVENVK